MSGRFDTLGEYSGFLLAGLFIGLGYYSRSMAGISTGGIVLIISLLLELAMSPAFARARSGASSSPPEGLPDD